jgi:hypothetical protein
MYYYRARYYAPGVGCFVSEDPLGFAGGETNLYRYAQNNPANLTDPTGLAVKLFLGATGSSGTVVDIGGSFGHVVIVAGGDGQFVQYDGGGQDSVDPQTGRPNPKRDDRLTGFPTGVTAYSVQSPYATAAEEIEALDRVFLGPLDPVTGKRDASKKLLQLPYSPLGPNSNTYARQLLELAGFTVNPTYEERQEVRHARDEPHVVTVRVEVGPTTTVGWHDTSYGGPGSRYDAWGRLRRVWRSGSGIPGEGVYGVSGRYTYPHGVTGRESFFRRTRPRLD